MSILTTIRTASEINQMTAEELQKFVSFLSPQTCEALSNYTAFALQEKELNDIEIQEPVC